MRCSIDDCEGPVRGRGLCNRHYRRMQRHGDPMKGRTPDGAPLALLEQAVASATDECIIWPFSKGSNGYGQISLNGKMTPAHRAVLERTAGLPPTPQHHAAHAPLICHNPACVNPRHLRWAAPAENTADRYLDGTHIEGEAHASAKLTDAQVLAIRADPRRHRQIAVEYGISKSQVSRIKLGQTRRSLAATATATAEMDRRAAERTEVAA